MKVLLKKTVALLLCAVLLLAGCSSADTTWVYEYEGETLPAGLYISFLIDAISGLEVKDQEAHEGEEGYETPALKKLLQTTVDDVPADEWVRAKALERSQQYFWSEKAFADRDLTVKASDEADIEEMVSQGYSDYHKNNGIGEASMRAYLRNLAKLSEVFEAVCGPEGELAVSEDELKAAFERDYVKADYLYLYKATEEDEDGVSAEEQNAALKTQAEEYVQRLKDGEEFEQLIYEQELSYATEETKALVTKPEKGFYTMVATREYSAYYGQDLIDALFDAKVDEPAYVETESAYLVLARHDILQDQGLFEQRRSDILYAEKYQDFEEYMNAQASQLNLTANQDALNKYIPASVKSN